MRLYKIISESTALLLLTSGLVAAPLAVFSHDCSTCPASCCSHEEDGCCGDQAASCAGHPFCDECAIFSSQNAILAGSGFNDFARSQLTNRYPIQNHLNSAAALQGSCTAITDFTRGFFHSSPHLASTVLRI